MSLYARILPPRDGFCHAATADEVTAGLSLAGRTILVTGCNSGLGFETLRVLALRGAHVIGTARTLEKAQAACQQVIGRVTGVACELSDPASVRHCIAAVKRHGPLDIIIGNAGIMALPTLQQAHGYELQFFTNHIGHFMLVNGLLDVLADQGRVVMISSRAHRSAPKQGIEFDNLSGEKGYRPGAAYGQSKLANILFAKELARRLQGSGKGAYAVHPGVIRTNLFRHINAPVVVRDAALALGSALMFKTIPQGAATGCYVATHPGVAALSGAYFVDCHVANPRPDANDPALARALWDVSECIVAGLG